MLSFTDAALQAQLALLIWPLGRILGLFMSMPFLSDMGVPTPAKILMGVVITLAISPTLVDLPSQSVGSWDGLLILAREILIGTALGLVMQCLFAAVSLGGELIGTQMGLGFSTIYDPGTESTTTTLSSVWVAFACLLFFAIDGHLMIIASLIHSFKTLPIGVSPFPLSGLKALPNYGGVLFLYGLMLSLPVTLTMILINLALGILSRAAPQLSLFSIGFPITLASGLGAIVLGLPTTLNGFSRLWGVAIEACEHLTTVLR